MPDDIPTSCSESDSDGQEDENFCGSIRSIECFNEWTTWRNNLANEMYNEWRNRRGAS